mgnify:CR=1 FL=1
MLLPLTEIQTKVFVAINSYIDTNGYSPTIPEICKAVERKGVTSELTALKKKGWVTKAEDRGMRALEVTDEAKERVKDDSQLKLGI